MTSESQELKPCPFCHTKLRTDPEQTVGVHEINWCFLSGELIASLKSWNRRSPSPDSGLVEAIGKSSLDAIPSNWTDNLLTGKDSIPMPWNCPEIERFCAELKKRIAAALSAHQPKEAP